MHELNTYRGVIVMILMNDEKFEGKLTCHFKIDMRNLTNFDQSTKNTQSFHFDWFRLCKVLSTEELSFMTLKSDAKFDEKLACASKNDMRTLANFHQSTRKSENWDFHGTFLFKVENV